MASFRMPPVREWAQGLLVEPHYHLRNWDYGPPGQQFDCWIVAKLPDGKWGVAYSDYGHGDHWGLVSLEDPWFGPDSAWYLLLEDAFIGAGWEGELPERYEVS